MIAVRASVRMKILLKRLGDADEKLRVPLLPGAVEKTVHERLSLARVSLRNRDVPHASAAAPSSPRHVNWLYNDMYAIKELMTASYLNLLLVTG